MYKDKKKRIGHSTLLKPPHYKHGFSRHLVHTFAICIGCYKKRCMSFECNYLDTADRSVYPQDQGEVYRYPLGILNRAVEIEIEILCIN